MKGIDVNPGFGQWVETALAGTGGLANASANGGVAGIGDVNAGGNVGTTVAVGDAMGNLICDT
jgi:hypothetical protein